MSDRTLTLLFKSVMLLWEAWGGRRAPSKWRRRESAWARLGRALDNL